MAFDRRPGTALVALMLVCCLPLAGEAQQASPAQAPASTASSSPGGTAAAPAVELERNDTNFRLLDTNQNGKIELDEDFTSDDPRLEQFGDWLRSMDLDGDGIITREEFLGLARPGGTWRRYLAALAAVIAFAGLCIVVDSVLDKDRRFYLLPGLAASLLGGALSWFAAADTVRELQLPLTIALTVTLLTLVVAVILGKPVEEEPIEPFVPAGQQQKVYVIGSGGKSKTAQQKPASTRRPASRPARPPRRPRRPPPSR